MKQHLILQELTLQPSAEELPVFSGWLMARVAEGFGYWLQHEVAPVQLMAGDGFIAASDTEGRLRASQLDPLKLNYFTVHPQHLDGVLTVAEWHQIEMSQAKAMPPLIFFKSGDSVGLKFSRLTHLSHGERLPLRCALLQLWAAATADALMPQDFAVENGNKLRDRFWRLFSHMTKIELCLSSPMELARQINCSERHFRGLFRREFGVSLHTYQTELRRQQACQLAEPSENGAKPAKRRSGSRPASRLVQLEEARSVLGHLPEEDEGIHENGRAVNGNGEGHHESDPTQAGSV